jgi:hypothetical protein
MRSANKSFENIEDEIVFALKEQTVSAPPRQLPPERRETPRQPIQVENRDLESAIDDMLARFPKTLEYLAK